MKQKSRGAGSYFLFLAFLILLMFAMNYMNKPEYKYTQAQLIQDVNAGTVKAVYIYPNKEAPTGYATIHYTSNVTQELYATDIRTLESALRENGCEPIVMDIQRESWFLTTAHMCHTWSDQQLPLNRPCTGRDIIT